MATHYRNPPIAEAGREIRVPDTREFDPSLVIAIQDALNEVEQAYGVLVADSGAVSGYMLGYPDLLRSVPIACGLARTRFGRYAELRLALSVSYEDPTDRFLCLNVRLAQYPADMMVHLEEVRGDYARTTRSDRDWVLITTDFQEPWR
jgi:hypothetical protein